jgi:hypothetical protein
MGRTAKKVTPRKKATKKDTPKKTRKPTTKARKDDEDEYIENKLEEVDSAEEEFIKGLAKEMKKMQNNNEKESESSSEKQEEKKKPVEKKAVEKKAVEKKVVEKKVPVGEKQACSNEILPWIPSEAAVLSLLLTGSPDPFEVDERGAIGGTI